MERIKYLSNATIETLRSRISDNAARYRSGDFSDLMNDGEWGVELQLEADLSMLNDLDASGKPEAEIGNSLLVWKALQHLPPSLAYEEGIWVRLTHVECLDYARRRWLSTARDEKEFQGNVEVHFFAATRTRRRDDNAISRLWWNAYLAHGIAPDNPRSALQLLLKRADSRLSLVERPYTATRMPLVAGIMRAADCHPWITATETSFRSFMKVLNRLGGGRVFEAIPDQEIDAFLLDCAERAGMNEPAQRAA
jgi:hypothetical protein